MTGQKITEFNECTRVRRCRQLLQSITKEKLDKTFFTDEKKFTVEPPKNNKNDVVYRADAQKKKNTVPDERLFTTRNHFSKSVMGFCWCF